MPEILICHHGSRLLFPPPLISADLGIFFKFFSLTIRHWILVPDARKTLIWHSDFHFLHTFGTKKFQFFQCLRCSHGGVHSPFPKFMDPPLTMAYLN